LTRPFGGAREGETEKREKRSIKGKRNKMINLGKILGMSDRILSGESGGIRVK